MTRPPATDDTRYPAGLDSLLARMARDPDIVRAAAAHGVDPLGLAKDLLHSATRDRLDLDSECFSVVTPARTFEAMATILETPDQLDGKEGGPP